MSFLLLVLDAYTLILIARVILSWLTINMNHPAIRFIYQVTEPLLQPIRKIIPPIGCGLDISPLVLFLLIVFLKRAILGGF